MIKYKKWLGILLVFPLLFITRETTFAQSSTNYKIKRSVLDQSGTPSQSTRFKITDAVGQPSPLGLTVNNKYHERSGFFALYGILPPNPVLVVSPITLDFGSTDNSKTFQISNSGSGTLTWTVTENPDKAWLTSINPNQGAGDATVTVTVDRTQLTGNNDTGELLVNSNGGTQNIAVRISKPVADVPITPVAKSPQSAGTEFWVDVDVGTNSEPVTNLFGVSFDLDFSNTALVDVVTSYSVNILAGDFLGSDVVFFYNVDETAGKINLAITRKTGAGGINGSGTVAKIKFKTDPVTPNNTLIKYTISNVSANDPVGEAINLIPGTVTVTISGGLTIWPGDTNDPFDPLDVVNQADILPIGLHWGKSGPKRTCHPPTQEMMWMAHTATPWTPDKNATYADANGDGIVNQADVLVIGLNWGKTHLPLPAKTNSINEIRSDTAAIKLKLNGDMNPGHYFYIDVWVRNVVDLFGLSYELLYTPTEFVSIDSIKQESDNLLGDDLLFFTMIDSTKKDTLKISVAFSMKFGQSAVTADSGRITRLRAYMSPKSIANQSQTQIWLDNIFANDLNGNQIQFHVEQSNKECITAVAKKASRQILTEFTLLQCYPNPFNQSTTIEYYLPTMADAKLAIFDLQGRLVRELINGSHSAGYHKLNWDSRDDAGQLVASGMYFYRLEAKATDARRQSVTAIRKLILMK
jgi:hypothetical protein